MLAACTSRLPVLMTAGEGVAQRSQVARRRRAKVERGRDGKILHGKHTSRSTNPGFLAGSTLIFWRERRLYPFTPSQAMFHVLNHQDQLANSCTASAIVSKGCRRRAKSV